MSDKALPPSPGEKLASLRMEAGRSLDQLAQATKIPPAMLEAIEQDEYHKITGDLYVKSFLRSYAAEVGVEAEEILDLYAAFTGTAAGRSDDQDPAVWRDDEVQVQRLGVPWRRLVLVAVAVLVVALVVWYVVARSGGDGPESEAQALDGPGQTSLRESRDGEEPGPGHGSLLAGGPLADAVPVAKNSEDAGASDEGGATESPDPKTTTDQPADEGPAVAEVSSPVPREPAVEQPTDSKGLPQVLPGTPDAVTLDGRTWPVVLRLICPAVAEVAVKKDGDREFSGVNWSDQVRPLPSDGQVRAGWAYHVNEGLVVYWGAADHFSLKVDDPEGLKAAINGDYRDIGSLRPGQEIILNDPEVIRFNLPSARNGG